MYRIANIETAKNYSKSGYGCMKLMRDLDVTIVDGNGDNAERYEVTCEVDDSFGCRTVSSPHREDSTEHTLTSDTVLSMIADYYE